jgi:hypothetical protein
MFGPVPGAPWIEEWKCRFGGTDTWKTRLSKLRVGLNKWSSMHLLFLPVLDVMLSRLYFCVVHCMLGLWEADNLPLNVIGV